MMGGHTTTSRESFRLQAVGEKVFMVFHRTAIPSFFVCACLYLVPLIAKGPTLNMYMEVYYAEMRDYWWTLLVQIRNYYPDLIKVG